MILILGFLLLTAVYTLVFTCVVAAFEGWSQAWSNLRASNNRRWVYIVAMAIITFFIACENPGDALLPEALRNLPKDVVSDTARTQVKGGWSYFMYGNNPPPAVKEPVIETTFFGWFFWKAFWMYLISVIIYFPIAFWDEFCNGIRAMRDLYRERHGEHQAAVKAAQAAARRPRKKGEPAPDALTYRKFWTTELAFDMFSAFLAEFLARRWRWGGTNP